MSIFRCVNLKMEGIYLPVYGDEGDSYKIPIESGVVIFITQFVSTENVGCDLESNTEVECVSPLYFYLVDVSSDNDVGSKVPKTAFGRNIVRHLRIEHVPEYVSIIIYYGMYVK